MALNPQLTNAAASAAADAVVDRIDVGGQGYLRIYDGTQAATADTAVGAQVLLAELRWSATAFGAAAAGVATANAITSDASANATGTASWFRVLDGGGVDVTDNVFDGTVGTSGSDLNLNTVAISAGATVACSAFTYTQSKT
jgi:hypothetical protein